MKESSIHQINTTLIQKHTIMERFEPGYVVSAQERADMKRKRIANEGYTLSVLDTMKISNRKRKQLLRDLKFSPFSDRLSKFIVDTRFDDEGTVSQKSTDYLSAYMFYDWFREGIPSPAGVRNIRHDA